MGRISGRKSGSTFFNTVGNPGNGGRVSLPFSPESFLYPRLAALFFCGLADEQKIFGRRKEEQGGLQSLFFLSFHGGSASSPGNMVGKLCKSKDCSLDNRKFYLSSQKIYKCFFTISGRIKKGGFRYVVGNVNKCGFIKGFVKFRV